MSSEGAQAAEPQDGGFLVVRTPASWYREFEVRAHSLEFEQGWGEGWADYRKRVRAEFPKVDPASYEGIDRAPMERWDPDLNARLPKEYADDRDVAAQRTILARLGPDPDPLYEVESFAAELLPDLGLAAEVAAAADCPDEWEVIQVRRVLDGVRSTTLGFDIGYWGRGWYSILRDCVIAPQWHPTPPEAFAALHERVASELLATLRHRRRGAGVSSVVSLAGVG